MALIVAFEGIPGGGKSTVVPKIKRKLMEEHDLRVMKVDIEETGEAPFFRPFAHRYPLDSLKRRFIFWIIRLEQDEEIQRLVQDQDVILIDQFILSTFAYDGEAVPNEVLRWFKGELKTKPDITFVFDVSIKEALIRKGESRTLQDRGLAERLHRWFQTYAKLHKKGERKRRILVDAEDDPDKIAEFCVGEILRRILEINKPAQTKKPAEE